MSCTSRCAGLFGALAVLACAGCGKGTTQPSPAPCVFTLSGSSFSLGAAGGSGTVSISTDARCAWTARADASWLSITGGASGSGPGVVNFTVGSNPDPSARSGSLTIAEHTVSVAQEGAAPCTYEISPSSAIHTKDGGTGSVAVSAGGGCAWTASSSASWLSIAPGSDRGSGSGVVSYIVARNSDVAGRSASILVAGRAFPVTQSGDTGACQYSVGAVEFTPCMLAVTLATTITTQAGCPWTAEPGASWIAVPVRSGSGSASLSFSVAENWDAPRSAVVQVRWPTPTAGQNLRVAQAGCRYAVSTAALSFGAAGGSGRFDVIQQSDPTDCGGPLQNACMWTAQSDSGWITVTSSMPRAGDDPVSFVVAPNTGAGSRTGTISVRDKVVRITQAGT